jgi:hypothetical protein
MVGSWVEFHVQFCPQTLAMPKKRKAAISRASNLEAARETLSVKRQKSVDPVTVEREFEADVDVGQLVCPQSFEI